MNLREAYARAAYASLEWTEEWERAVDRVAAAGFADPLGIALWKIKYLLESSSYDKAFDALVAEYRARSPHEAEEIIKKVVNQALREFIAQFCKDCKGAKELVVGEKRVICHTCGGSGIRRYSDFERARAMGVSLERARKLQRPFTWLSERCQDLDRQTNAVLVFQLGRLDE